MGIKTLRSGVASFAAGIVLLLGPATALAGNTNNGNDNEHNKVTICHQTGNGSYIQIKPNANGDVDGHAKHGDDIIPPFDYNDHGSLKHFVGLNWTTQGQAIWNNGCKVPEGGHGGGCDEDNGRDSDCHPQKDCDGDYDHSPMSECTPPQKDCDGDYDHSPVSDCEGSITVVKHLSPTTDTGLFNLMVGNTTVATNVGNNGQGTASHLVAGNYMVSENAGTGTSMANYTSSVSCTNQVTGTTSVNVNLAAGQNVTCMFTNTRGGGQGGGPTTDCDNDTDNSPASECNTTTTTTTTTTGGQVLGASTTGGSGAAQVAVVPEGSVNGGEGAASRVFNRGSMLGLVGSILSVGSGLVMLNRRNN